MRFGLIVICAISLSILEGCSSTGSTSNQSDFKPSNKSRPITYQYADSVVAPWDTVNHFPKQGMTTPLVIQRVKPQYPKLAIQLKLEGKVLVKAYVGTDGIPTKVISLLVGNEVFERPTHDAVNGWRFKVPVEGEAPRPFSATLEFNYIFLDDTAMVIIPDELSAP